MGGIVCSFYLQNCQQGNGCKHLHLPNGAWQETTATNSSNGYHADMRINNADWTPTGDRQAWVLCKNILKEGGCVSQKCKYLHIDPTLWSSYRLDSSGTNIAEFPTQEDAFDQTAKPANTAIATSNARESRNPALWEQVKKDELLMCISTFETRRTGSGITPTISGPTLDSNHECMVSLCGTFRFVLPDATSLRKLGNMYYEARMIALKLGLQSEQMALMAETPALFKGFPSPIALEVSQDYKTLCQPVIDQVFELVKNFAINLIKDCKESEAKALLDATNGQQFQWMKKGAEVVKEWVKCTLAVMTNDNADHFYWGSATAEEISEQYKVFAHEVITGKLHAADAKYAKEQCSQQSSAERTKRQRAENAVVARRDRLEADVMAGLHMNAKNGSAPAQQGRTELKTSAPATAKRAKGTGKGKGKGKGSTPSSKGGKSGGKAGGKGRGKGRGKSQGKWNKPTPEPTTITTKRKKPEEDSEKVTPTPPNQKKQKTAMTAVEPSAKQVVEDEEMATTSLSKKKKKKKKKKVPTSPSESSAPEENRPRAHTSVQEPPTDIAAIIREHQLQVAKTSTLIEMMLKGGQQKSGKKRQQ